MLDLMRKQAGSWMIKFIIAAITIVFVFWGVGSFRDRSGNRVAEVNGEPISLDEYRQTYNNLVERLRQSFGDRLDEDTLKALQVRQQAMNQLIDRRLMLQQAEALNFKITDQELAKSIADIPAFQTAGVFDPRVYNLILSRNRLTPEAFEAIQREAMLVEKLNLFITSNIRVSESEARDWFNWQNASVRIDYVDFNPENYGDVQADDAEVEAYFEKNKESYKTEPKIKARYLKFSPDAYASKIQISEEDIADFYKKNQDDFKTPKTVEARHILIRVAADADPEKVVAKQQEAMKVYEMAKQGKDFSELAKEFSEGPSAKDGGYLGAFKKEDMVKPFADKAFSMKAGEIGEPVRTDFGWHIIKVEKVNAASVLTQEEAAEQIRKKLIDQRAKTMAYDAAAAVYDTVFEGDDLVKAAESDNIELHVTDFFTRKGPEGVGDPARLGEAAFALQVGEISSILDLKDGYFILQPLEKIPAEVPPLESVFTRVKADLIKEKQREEAKKAADDFLTAVTEKGDWNGQVEAAGKKAESSEWFKRSGSIQGIGYEPEIARQAFQLSGEKPTPDQAIEGQKGYYVIHFKDRKLPDAAEFKDQRDSLEQSLLQQKQRTALTQWMENLRGESEITIEKGFMD